METSSRRVALSLGLGLTTIASLFTRARGQTGKPAEPDGGGNAAPVVAIGTISMDAVLKGYTKVNTLASEFKRAAAARQKDLEKISAEAQREAQALQDLEPGTPGYQDIEAKITRLKEQFESGRKKAQAEFSRKESEMMASLYKEVQEASAVVARRRKLAFVLRVANEPDVRNADAVFALIQQAVVYAAPEADVTNEVVALLNQRG